jgi:hypothetical protein
MRYRAYYNKQEDKMFVLALDVAAQHRFKTTEWEYVGDREVAPDIAEQLKWAPFVSISPVHDPYSPDHIIGSASE